MIFNSHYTLRDKHAYLSASKSSWVNYDDDKFDRVFMAAMAAARGTELHALAHNLIRLGVKLPRTEATLNMYVNDCIGYRMSPEQVLFYSENCFGTADAISFRKNKLRVSDLKTGVIEASPRQLLVYAALFCLEYKFRPFDIEIELRIYQNDEMRLYEADPDEVFHIMDKIVAFNKRIIELKEEALS